MSKRGAKAKAMSELHLDGKKYKVPMAVHAFLDQLHKVNQGLQQQSGALVETIYQLVDKTDYKFGDKSSMEQWEFIAQDAHAKYSEFLESKMEETLPQDTQPSEASNEVVEEGQQS